MSCLKPLTLSIKREILTLLWLVGNSNALQSLLRVFGFWTVGQTEQDIRRCGWKIMKNVHHEFKKCTFFYRPNHCNMNTALKLYFCLLAVNFFFFYCSFYFLCLSFFLTLPYSDLDLSLTFHLEKTQDKFIYFSQRFFTETKDRLQPDIIFSCYSTDTVNWRKDHVSSEV